MLYASLAVAAYGAALLPGELVLGALDWRGVALWVILLWFLDRGSRVAWWIALAATVWTLLALAFMGVGLGLDSAALVVLFVLQVMVLFAPSMRPRRTHRYRATGSAN